MHFKPTSGLFFAPDTGNGTGTGGGQTPTQSNAGEKGEQQTTPSEDKPKPITFESETKLQEHIDAIVKDRLKRANEKAEKDAEETRKKVEQDALAKNAKWQELAETRETEIKATKAELDNAQEKAERYEKALKEQLEATKKGLPEAVLSLLEKLDVAEQLEWIAKNREALATQGQNKRSAGVPPTPLPADQRQLLSEEDKDALRQSRAYYRNHF